MRKLQISLLGFLFAGFMSIFSTLIYAAEPVAMITDLKGEANLVGKKSPLALLTYLSPGDEIELGEGAQMVVTYFDESSELSFKGPARIAIQQNVAKALKGKPAKLAKLDKDTAASAGKFVRSGRLTFAAVEMRAFVIKPTLLSPVNTKVSSVAPLFKWKSVNEAEGYLLVVSDEDGGTILEAHTTTNSWQWPMDKALKPGVKYQWSVQETLKSGEKVSATSSFTLADADMLARVASKRPGADAAFSEKITYAIFLESEGFREDAKVLWRELSALRPEDPNLKFRAK